MARPSEVPPPPAGLRWLADADVPDFLDREPRAVLAFLDPLSEPSRGVEERCRRLALGAHG